MRTTEELCIKKLNAAIMGIKAGTIEPRDANCGFLFKNLKPLNEGMHDDLMKKYVEALAVNKDRYHSS